MSTTFERRDVRRVLLSSFIGSSIEFYDFILYSLGASLIFNKLFFTQLSPGVASIASFATLAVGYFIRPIGGIVFGHFGDRLGRKSMLVVTMSMMGGASFCIGLLPTQASIGTAAPLLLILIRLIQGMAVGGEWGGAALMAMEHAQGRNRGFAASFSNMGGPAGAALATTVFLLCSTLWKGPFLDWGWRVPFLFSAVLVGVGLFIRLKVTESPVFVEAQRQAAARREPQRPPLLEVLTRYPLPVILVALGGVTGLVLQGLLASFALPFAMGHGHGMNAVLWVTALVAVLQVITIPAFAALSDRVGRRPVMIVGTAATIVLIYPLLSMIAAGPFSLMLIAFLIGNPILQAMMYGPLAAFISEVFGASARYTGASLGYQLGTTIGGGLGPLAATTIMAGHYDGSPLLVSLMVVGSGVVSIVAIILTGRLANHADAEEAEGRVAAPARSQVSLGKHSTAESAARL